MADRQADEKSRAEKLRARRQQSRKETPTKPFGSSATRKQSQHRVPVTRRKTTPSPVINRNRNKVNVPLKSKGAELQLPAFPHLNLGWRLISGAIFVLSLAVVISFSSLSTFEVTAINLKGAQRLAAESILSQVNLSGTSIISINPQEVETRVAENFPSLSRVRVSTGLPSSVTIHVTERKPLILWQQNDATYWIDSEGVMFPVRGEAQVSLTVLANGNPPGTPLPEEQEIIEEPIAVSSALLEQPDFPRTTPEFVQGMLSLVDYIPENGTLQYDPKFGLGWQDPHGWLVYFGRDVSNIDIKLSEYQMIIAALQENDLTPALINLEFLHAPFYRLEQ